MLPCFEAFIAVMNDNSYTIVWKKREICMKTWDIPNQFPEESFRQPSRFTTVVCKICSDCWSHGLPRG